MEKHDKLLTGIWAALSALTLVTLFIGDRGLAGPGVILTLLLIALVKGQMVANWFMGLRHAGWLWRGIILGYFVVVGALVMVAYLMGLHA